MFASESGRAPGEELLGAKRRQHHEFVRVHVDGTVDQFLTLPPCGQAMVRNPQDAGDSKQLPLQYHVRMKRTARADSGSRNTIQLL
jgi:hypothetical protein